VELSSIKKDLYRRDFTINTLAVRLNHDRSGSSLIFSVVCGHQGKEHPRPP